MVFCFKRPQTRMIRTYISEKIRSKIRADHHREGSGFAKENAREILKPR